MKKNALTLICLMSVVSLIGGLASCTPGANTSGGSTTTNTGGDVKSVTFDFWHTFGQGIVDNIQKKIDAFHDLVLENEGIDVTINFAYQGSYDDIVSKITQGFSAGNVPTLAVAYPDHVANYLSAETKPGEYVVNIQTLIDDPTIGLGKEEYLGDTYGEDDFVASFLEEGRQFVREGTYTLPFMKSSEVMFYNEEAVLRALKVKDPTFVGSTKTYLENLSWDEFIEFADFIMDNKNSVLSTMEVPVYYDSDSNLFISKMFQNNIAYSSIGEDDKGVIDFESGQARTDAEAMVSELKQQYDLGTFTTKGLQGTYGSDYFTQMKSIFSIGSSGGAGYNIPTSDTFTVGVCRVPFDNDNPLYVSQGPCLTLLRNPSKSASENDLRVKYAWKFLKYITTPQNNVDICIYGSEGYIPVRESAYATDSYLEFLVSGEDYAKTAKILLDDINGDYLNTAVFTGSARLRDEVGGLITQVLAGHKSVTQAFEDAINTTKLFM